MKNKSALAVAGLAGFIIGVVIVRQTAWKLIKKLQTSIYKNLRLFLMMDKWVEIKQNGKNLSQYFENKHYKEIAIYGMSYAGKRLMDELEGSGIVVKYGIDQKADEVFARVDMLKSKDSLPTVDAIVVTPVSYFDTISKELAQKVNCPIISLEDILQGV